MAVDAKTGEVLREVQLDPAPFGITWSIERVGRFFVVKDDRETAAYDADAGKRLWKRSSGPTRVAYVGQKGERHVTIAPGPAGVEVLETDLETGESSSKLTLDGSMHYIGVHGTMTKEGLLFIATDQREVFAVDTRDDNGYRLVGRHSFAGSHALPPVATDSGVHVAVVERRVGGPVTNVATFDRASGELVSTHELPGTAQAIAPGKTGVVLDVKRSPTQTIERVVFRPHAPHIRLAISKSVNLSLAASLGIAAPPRLPRPPTVEIVAAPKPKPRTASARPEMLPEAPDADDVRPESSADGFRALLEVMRAKSDVLTRLVNALADRPQETVRLHDIGIRFRDPRIH